MFCQVTKKILIMKSDSYHCGSLGINYPVKDNIIFMGFKAEEGDSVMNILRDSQHHQGMNERLKSANSYKKISFPLIAQSIVTFNKLYGNLIEEGGITVKFGSGGDPSSNEIVYLGFDPYACDIEPNSLFVASFWDNHIQSKVKRIAYNCSSLPFPDSIICFIF